MKQKFKKTLKTMGKEIGLFLLLISFLASFYYINDLNYKKQKQIQANLVDHPEYLPKKDTVKYTSFGFKNVRADFYWLQTIQYIGGNAISSDYKKYLFAILDLITEFNPYFEHPYTIGQLLLPTYNERYESITLEEQDIYINQGIELGLKGIKNFCNQEKIDRIIAENDLNKIWTEEKYKNPCRGYIIPYYLAYIYYYYKNDPLTAAGYYKVSSANDDSLKGAKVMAAIMQGKGGEREKSYLMFLNMAKFVEQEDEVCVALAEKMEQVGFSVFRQKITPLDGNLLKTISDIRDNAFGTFDPEIEDKIGADTKCTNYVNKATRELNLAYIENANTKYKQENDGQSAYSAEELYEKKYIDYLPVDFQQYEDYGIVYKYNKDIGQFDYEMGNY